MPSCNTRRAPLRDGFRQRKDFANHPFDMRRSLRIEPLQAFINVVRLHGNVRRAVGDEFAVDRQALRDVAIHTVVSRDTPR